MIFTLHRRMRLHQVSPFPPISLFGIRSQSLIQNENLGVTFDFLFTSTPLHGIAKICAFKLLDIPPRANTLSWRTRSGHLQRPAKACPRSQPVRAQLLVPKHCSAPAASAQHLSEARHCLKDSCFLILYQTLRNSSFNHSLTLAFTLPSVTTPSQQIQAMFQ